VSFRRPQKTPLQAALRQAERSVSGALFLLFSTEDPNQKVDLRARFVSGVCSVLIYKKRLTMLQAEKQLKPTQLNILRQLPEHRRPPPDILWGDWVQGRDPSVGATLGSWLELGASYVAGSLRKEPPPTAVDWGQREQELNAQFSSYPGKIHVDLGTGLLRLVDGQTVCAQSALQVVGSYRAAAKSYLAGWADPTLSQRVRPLPIFGCASQLFRLELVDAQSEAHRAAWLGGVLYLFEHRLSDRVYFLGLDKLEEPGSNAGYEIEDLRPEMFSRVETLLRAADHYEPERMKSLLNSQSQEVRRLLPLVEGNRAVSTQVSITADILEEVATRVSTHNLLGVRRSELSGKDREMVQKELSQMRQGWGPEEDL
jgi:hypothetical protein